MCPLIYFRFVDYPAIDLQIFTLSSTYKFSINLWLSWWFWKILTAAAWIIVTRHTGNDYFQFFHATPPTLFMFRNMESEFLTKKCNKSLLLVYSTSSGVLLIFIHHNKNSSQRMMYFIFRETPNMSTNIMVCFNIFLFSQWYIIMQIILGH